MNSVDNCEMKTNMMTDSYFLTEKKNTHLGCKHTLLPALKLKSDAI